MAMKHSLSDYTDPSQYKSYDELKAKLNRVLGTDAGITADMATMTTAPIPTMEQSPQAEPAPVMESSSDEDDTLSYFNKLANES